MNVDPKQLTAFIQKCQKDPVFWIQNFCYIEHPKAGVIPFKLFNYQKNSLKAFLKHRFNIYRKTRQSGISTQCGAFALWYAMFFPSKTILIVSKRDQDAKEFLRKHVKFLYEHLPPWMRSIWVGVANEHSLKLSNGSVITSLTSSPDTLRSNASSLNIIDEAAFMPHMQEMWAGGWSTIQMGGSVIVISTTNGIGNWYWRFWTDAESHHNDFHPIVVNWWDMTWEISYFDELAHSKIVLAPTKGIKKCQTAEEVEKYGPYWSPWLETEYRNLTDRGNDAKFRQEVLAEFIGTGRTILSRQTLSIISNSIAQFGKDYKTVGKIDYVNPVTREREMVDFRNELWVWKEPIRGNNTTERAHRYILGCDTSTGEGTDFSAIEVFDVDEGEQVAELQIKTRPKILAKMIDYIGRWYNNALAVVESTGIGRATVQELHEDLGYQNVYRSRVKSSSKISRLGPLGFPTTGQSKMELDKTLIDNLGENGYTIYSSRLYKEATIYVQLTGSRSGAEPGSGNNDDMMIATALALIGVSNVIAIAGHNLVPLHNVESPLLENTVDMGKFGGDVLTPLSMSSEMNTGRVSIDDELMKFQNQIGGITHPSSTKNNIATVKFKNAKLVLPKRASK